MAEVTQWIGACYTLREGNEGSQSDSQINQETLDRALGVVGLAESAEDIYERVRTSLGVSKLRFVWLENVAVLKSKTYPKELRESILSKLEQMTRGITTYMPLQLGNFSHAFTLEEVRALNYKAPQQQRKVEIPAISYTEIVWTALFEREPLVGLLENKGSPLWAVIDGVNCREAAATLGRSDAQSCCLYSTTDPATEALAPWLVRLEQDSDIVQWLSELPQDQHWGILFHSTATMKQLKTHLRKYTMLWTPANEQAPVYFRFYDPRVALDMSQVLQEWKLARFMALMDTLYVPLSPLMILPSDQDELTSIELNAATSAYQGKLIALALHPHYREDSGSKSFSISEPEFTHFSALQKQKSNRKLARSLTYDYPDYTPITILHYVEYAGQLGKDFNMKSVKQITTLAKCLLEFGLDMFEKFPSLLTVLQDKSSYAWQKRNIIEEWFPRGQKAIEKQNSAGQHTATSKH